MLLAISGASVYNLLRQKGLLKGDLTELNSISNCSVKENKFEGVVLFESLSVKLVLRWLVLPDDRKTIGHIFSLFKKKDKFCFQKVFLKSQP